MASLSFFNWPQQHNTAAFVPPPDELLPFHDQFSTFNNIPLQNSIKYPTLSSNITTTQQHTPLPNLGHEYYSYPFVPNVFDHDELFLVNPMDQMQTDLPTFPEVYQPEPHPFPEIYLAHSEPLPFTETYYTDAAASANLCSLEQLHPELPPLPDIYPAHVEEKRISAQSMAARIRRRKISEKTSELGKLIPGGHRMNTAEMFQAAFNYIKFLQAQAAVLELMPQSTGLCAELQALVTTPSVQEKLYTAGKCIAAQTLADDQQGTNN